jgi:hypothetical protein
MMLILVYTLFSGLLDPGRFGGSSNFWAHKKPTITLSALWKIGLICVGITLVGVIIYASTASKKPGGIEVTTGSEPGGKSTQHVHIDTYQV